MGTPGITGSNGNNELEPVSVHERVVLRELSREMARTIDLGKLPEVLESLRQSLMPLVHVLGKTLGKAPPFNVSRSSRKLSELSHALLVYNGHAQGTFSLALARNGKWIVEVYSSRGGKDTRLSLENSEDLASSILGRMDELVGAEVAQNFILMFTNKSDLEFFFGLVRYVCIMDFFEHCYETMAKLIDEREEKLRMMRQRIGMVRELSEFLDPLALSGQVVPTSQYAIWLEYTQGDSRSTGDYLHIDALDPFRKILARKPSEGWTPVRNRDSKYVERSSVVEHGTLKRFVFVLSDIASEISRGASAIANVHPSGGALANDHLDRAAHIFNRDLGRVPLSAGELGALRSVASAIKNAASSV